MTQLTDIRKPVEAELEAYQALFDRSLSHSDGFLDTALSYIRGRKGKMMRPILVLLVAKEQASRQGKEVPQSSLMSAVTLELLHTASLVHDDVVDESNQRRGQKSVNAVYDNKIAVLLGDYLLAHALRAAALTGHLSIVETIASLGGTLSEGEIYQLANTHKDEITEDSYYKVIRHKTAALFRDCARLGALSSVSTDEKDKDAAERFTQNATRLGEIIGIIFQIRDDIFDYFDDADIGKPRGNDMAEGKLTLPVIHALLSTKDEDMRQVALKVRNLAASSDEIHSLIQFTKQHGGIEYAEAEMQRLRCEALQLLSEFHNEDIRTALTQYIDFVIARSI